LTLNCNSPVFMSDAMIEVANLTEPYAGPTAAANRHLHATRPEDEEET
jgi:hypothetical protein